MTREEYEEIREFAETLQYKRAQLSDGALLDQCQKFLDKLVAELAPDFEEHPHINDVPPVKRVK